MPPAKDKLNRRAAVGGQGALSGRELQRRQTRQRVYAAALAEFKRTGMAAADVGAIAAAAGVARGTFYFHFPTKEHVLAELERHEEARVATQLSKFLAGLQVRCNSPSIGHAAENLGNLPSGQPFLGAALAEVVRLMTAMERRVGKALFREMLGLHFSPRRPDVLPGADKWAEYPVMTLVVGAVERARERGEVYAGADALRTAQFFMLGLYAMLITSHEYAKAERAEILDNFVATVLRGVESR
jgi:AcrR family transcriptional regulator